METFDDVADLVQSEIATTATLVSGGGSKRSGCLLGPAAVPVAAPVVDEFEAAEIRHAAFVAAEAEWWGPDQHGPEQP